MLRASAVLRAASTRSMTMSLRATVYRGSRPLIPELMLSDCSISADRTSKTRLSADISWPDSYGLPDVSHMTDRIRVWWGVESLGYTERLSRGVFRIDDIDRDDFGAWSAKCSGLESYVIDDRFLTPRTPPRGTSTTGEIVNLIQESLPGQRVVLRNTRNKLVQATAPWQRERWDAIDRLSDSIDAEVYADANGDFVIDDVPLLSRGRPVLRLREGEDGVIITRKVSKTRDRMYNVSVASGQSSDPAVPPVYAVAYDEDPNSPTWWRGPFGRVPRFYSSQFLTTEAQCLATARSYLEDAKAQNNTLSFNVAPTMFWLEVGDVVRVDTLDGKQENHLLQKMKGSLLGQISFDTLSTKNAQVQEG